VKFRISKDAKPIQDYCCGQEVLSGWVTSPTEQHEVIAPRFAARSLDAV